MANEDQFDVVILGGGLAGLSLAIQLKRVHPATTILIAEKNPHPLPEAAHKVGESSVEIGANYYGDVLRMKEHIEANELPKLGLRFFFPASDNRDITRRVEVGPKGFWPDTEPSYQLDRGRFENALGEEAARLGAKFWDETVVREVKLDGERHSVRLQRKGGDSVTVSARWVVDASGRASILKRQLKLVKKNGHSPNAAWFRISERIKVDDWSNDPTWKARVPSGERWLSTVHLMGSGYWVWLIPLGSGSTSVGIVADDNLHPFAEINTFERSMAWLHRYEPQLADILESRRDKLQDFLVLKHYSYDCGKFYSGDRWCLSGEAGAFSDPFYSPGSDFIAYGNTQITDLIVRELNGEDVHERAEIFNVIYRQAYEIILSLYEGQYPMWGNAQVMAVKTMWDYTLYWGSGALVFFRRKWTDLGFMLSASGALERIGRINARVQGFFREWDELSRGEYRATFVDPMDMGFILKLHRQLSADLNDADLLARLTATADLLEAMAVEFFRKAAPLVGSIPENAPINPHAISLKPQQWEADGLFVGRENTELATEVATELRKLWFDRAV